LLLRQADVRVAQMLAPLVAQANRWPEVKPPSLGHVER